MGRKIDYTSSYSAHDALRLIEEEDDDALATECKFQGSTKVEMAKTSRKSSQQNSNAEGEGIVMQALGNSARAEVTVEK